MNRFKSKKIISLAKSLYAFIVLSVILLTGCLTKSDNSKLLHLEDFKYVDSINRWISVPVHPTLYKVKGLTIFKNNLFVADDYDTLLHVFTINNLEYKGSYILKGNGPCELILPHGSNFNSNGREILMADASKVLKLDFDSSGVVFVKKEIKMPGAFYPLNYVFELSDSILCSSEIGVDVSREFISYNLKTKEVDRFGDLPKWVVSHPLKNRHGILSVGHISVNNELKRFVRAYMYQPEIRFFDFKGNVTKSIKIEVVDERSTSHLDFNQGNNSYYIIHFRSIYSTPEYVYAFLHVVDIFNGIAITSPTILIFDWDGEPVGRIGGEGMDCDLPSVCFAINPTNSSLYTINKDILDSIYIFNFEIPTQRSPID
jgi:hypothetical protein